MIVDQIVWLNALVSLQAMRPTSYGVKSLEKFLQLLRALGARGYA